MRIRDANRQGSSSRGSAATRTSPSLAPPRRHQQGVVVATKTSATLAPSRLRLGAHAVEVTATATTLALLRLAHLDVAQQATRPQMTAGGDEGAPSVPVAAAATVAGQASVAVAVAVVAVALRPLVVEVVVDPRNVAVRRSATTAVASLAPLASLLLPLLDARLLEVRAWTPGSLPLRRLDEVQGGRTGMMRGGAGVTAEVEAGAGVIAGVASLVAAAGRAGARRHADEVMIRERVALLPRSGLSSFIPIDLISAFSFGRLS